jgi:nucleoside-diphosphate-sugar epimerase
LAPRQVLVVGGTGFLGRRITEAFARRGDNVAVLTRGQHSVSGLSGVELVVADRHNEAALRAALGTREFDVVADNIAYAGEDVTTLLDVLDGRIGHYVVTSSSAVYADRYVRRPLRENDADLTLRLPVDAPNPFHSRLGQAYANGKRDAEQRVHESHVPWTILRPPVVLGADDRTLRVWWFVQRLLDGHPLLVPEWGAGRVFQVAWTHDFARAAVGVSGNAAAFGRAYNVAQAELYTAESWIETAAAILGVRPVHARFAEDDAPLLGLADYKLPVAGRPFGHCLVDLSAIRHDAGFDPSPESVWLAETLLGCARNPPRQNSPGYDQRGEEVRIARALLTRTWR